MRLQRFLADAGVAARRAAERLIEDGRVTVNGEVVRTLPAFVDLATDRVAVDGRPVRPAARRLYVMVNKPARVLTVAADEPGADRRTVLDLVDHPAAPRLFPVGRLDYDATGLVLLTNDGALAHRLTHPRYEVNKTYHLTVKGQVADQSLPKLEREFAKWERRAARAAGRQRPASGASLRVVRREPGKTILELTARSGRLAEAERTLAAAGHPVRHVERVALGPLRLRELARGRWRELERDELQALRRAARAPVAAETGAPAGPNKAHRPAPAPPGRRPSAHRPGARRPGAARPKGRRP